MARLETLLVAALVTLPEVVLAQEGTPRTPRENTGTQDANAPPATPNAEPPPPREAPPAHYYVEPATPSEESAPSAGNAAPGAAPPAGPSIYEPPPPSGAPIYEPPPPSGPAIYEPPPPPEPDHRSPRTAFWAGGRFGWFVPFGNLWADVFPTEAGCCAVRRRAWSDYATAGPAFELNAGARIARHYVLFALWERALLRAGTLDPNAFGGQQLGVSDLLGAGVRYSSDPDDVGFLVEVALGYRWFEARWENGTRLTATGSVPDIRLGLGADLRLSPSFSLSPMITLGSGVFPDATWSSSSGKRNARSALDENAQYANVVLSIGAHFDVY